MIFHPYNVFPRATGRVVRKAEERGENILSGSKI